MPHLPSYLKGFNLKKSMKIGNYEIENISGQHDELIRFRKYKYLIKINFRTVDEKGNPSQLLKEFSDHVRKNRVIYTRWDNPYECNFGKPYIISSNKNGVVIGSIGHCHRIFD